MTSRNFRIVGNMKMHTVSAVLDEYASSIGNRQVTLMVPYPYLSQAKKLFEGLGVRIGAQAVSAFEQGAYTGEVSADMLVDIGIEEVLVGHSETRMLGRDIAKELSRAQASGLEVIYCIGEDLDSYNQGRRFEDLTKQLMCLGSVDNLAIAYEPVWSIGSGKIPAINEIEEVVKMVRTWVERHFPGNSEKIDVLYGGSINQNNCFEIYQATSLDGFLVGGVSLKPGVMMEVIDLCS